MHAMARIRDLIAHRLTLALLAGVGGALLALWVVGAGGWQSVVLVVVTGVLTIAASEISGDREAARQRELRAADRQARKADEIAAATRALRLARLDRTRDTVMRMLHVSMHYVLGHRERAAEAFAKIDQVDALIGIDVELIGNQDARNAYESAVGLMHLEPIDPTAVGAIISAQAMVLTAFAEQEDRIAAGLEPLRSENPPDIKAQAEALLAKLVPRDRPDQSGSS